MKARLFLQVITFAFILFITNSACAEMKSKSFLLYSPALSGAGGMSPSTSFQMESTLGQPGVIGHGSSSFFETDLGFWYTLLVSSSIGDVNGDGVVNLEDVVTSLQVVTGMSPSEVMASADTDGDGRIDVSEAVAILKSLGSL